MAQETKSKKSSAKAGTKNLVIVESPAKAKTIEKYLGPDYEVEASMGHVRDLPKTTLGIDTAHGFTPQYILISGKENLVRGLKKEAASAKNVYLATDPDREGEAISWHLAKLLGLPMDALNRVTFNEITRYGVEQGMASPRSIDLDLVNCGLQIKPVPLEEHPRGKLPFRGARSVCGGKPYCGQGTGDSELRSRGILEY